MNGTGTVNVSALYKKRGWHIIFPVFLVSVVAFLDRVNIAYAGMTMTQTLDWLSPEIFGAGAGMFFIGYFFFEIPGSLVAARFDACRWIARIMFSWGLVCGLMAFMQSPFQFYLFRFLLGACEASLYPVIYAVLFPRWFMADELAKATSLMLTSLLIAAIIGAPLAGVLLEMQLFGLLGWQSLFLLEAVPALLLTFVFYFGIPDRPEKAKWLTEDERRYLVDTFAEETQRKNRAKSYSVWQAFTDKKVWLLCVIYFGQALGFWGFNFWMPCIERAFRLVHFHGRRYYCDSHDHSSRFPDFLGNPFVKDTGKTLARCRMYVPGCFRTGGGAVLYQSIYQPGSDYADLYWRLWPAGNLVDRADYVPERCCCSRSLGDD